MANEGVHIAQPDREGREEGGERGRRGERRGREDRARKEYCTVLPLLRATLENCLMTLLGITS